MGLGEKLLRHIGVKIDEERNKTKESLKVPEKRKKSLKIPEKSKWKGKNYKKWRKEYDKKNKQALII